MSTQSRLGRGAGSRMSRLLAAQRGRCFYCQGPLVLRQAGEPPSPIDATIDHFFPLATGGLDSWGNWVLACAPCNHAKADRPPDEAEVAHWNTLAGEWPFIRTIDTAFLQRKRCVACRSWISPMRLEASIRAGRATATCRRRCSQKLRRERQRQRGFQPADVLQPVVLPGHARRIPWWRRLAAAIHTVVDLLFPQARTLRRKSE